MPSYRFDNFTGRLKPSSCLQSQYPIAPNPLQSTEPATMIWDSLKTNPVRVANVTATQYSTVPPHILAAQKKFQPPGWRSKPVYLMGGTPDKILFGATLVLMAVGFIGCAEYVWRFAPQK